jgi:NAD+ synthase
VRFTGTEHRFGPGETAVACEVLAGRLRDVVRRTMHKRGVVVGISGGIDSSVTAALCVRAFGREHVLGLTMHEAESSDDTPRYASMLIDSLGIASVDEPLSPILDAVRCYARRDHAIRNVIPEYRANWQCKLVVPSVVDADRLPIYQVVVRSPDGEEKRARLPLQSYLEVVAATSFKQRTRKMLEYFHADRLNYAVAGTPNRLEYELGFFVKNGDGAADVKPIAHLYKAQVYQLAELLDIPADIRARPPTTDTYSMPQSQEELYFALPHDRMDACLWACDHDVPAADAAAPLGLTSHQVLRVYRDIAHKRAMAAHLHAPPAVLV